GVSIMKMDAGLDTGPVLTQLATRIDPEDTAQTLHHRLARLGAELLLKTIPDYVTGRIIPRPQPAEGASYARKITKADGQIDWAQPARTLWCRVRGLTPWPGAFTHYSAEGQRHLLKLWVAAVEPGSTGAPGTVLYVDKTGIVIACGQQALRVLELQREGGRRLSARDFLAGHVLPVGSHLGSGDQ